MMLVPSVFLLLVATAAAYPWPLDSSIYARSDISADPVLVTQQPGKNCISSMEGKFGSLIAVEDRLDAVSLSWLLKFLIPPYLYLDLRVPLLRHPAVCTGALH